MQSRNKPSMTVADRRHVEWVKSQPCVCCEAPPPSEAHEIEQGLWFTSLPVCPDCHRGSHNGIHGRQSIWRVKKLTELIALDKTIKRRVELA